MSRLFRSVEGGELFPNGSVVCIGAFDGLHLGHRALVRHAVARARALGVAAVAVAIFIVADRFTVAGLGEEIATNVGLNYRNVMLLGTALIAVATGVVTVVIGNLPFLGLIVPNLVSMVRGDDLRSNLPWVCLLGIAITTVCDLVGRTIIMPFEIPVSLILGVVGAVVFIIMLLRQRKRG